LRRLEYGRHVVFYRVEANGIVISRILHQRMLPELQSIDKDSPPDR
jgi:plasmid stabilization system protein ParE